MSKVVLHGVLELSAAFQALGASAKSPEASKAYLEGARIIQESAKRLAPMGTHADYSRLRPGGRGVSWVKGKLQKSIIAWWGRYPEVQGARAFVRVNTSGKWGRNRAPHGVLVVGGVKERRPTNKKFMSWPMPNNRGWVFAKHAERIPANPFIDTAVSIRGDEALKRAAVAMGEILEQKFAEAG